MGYDLSIGSQSEPEKGTRTLDLELHLHAIVECKCRCVMTLKAPSVSVIQATPEDLFTACDQRAVRIEHTR